MKKEWQKPSLEVLDINMTMAGPGLAKPDTVTVHDDDEHATVVLHHS